MLIAIASLVVSAACRDPSPAMRPDLVLIVVDTLRADHLSAYGYERKTSPFIDQLARRGVAFENAFAPSSWTKPSIGSLFTSRYPSEHGAVSFDRNLAPGLPTLAERLRDAGYATVGVSGNFVHVDEKSGLTRGFEVWKTRSFPSTERDERLIMSFGGENGKGMIRLRAPNADEVNREVLSLLPPASRAPLFLYVHYMEPHAGYTPPDSYRRAFERDPSPHADRPPASSAYVVELAKAHRDPGVEERRRLIDLYDAEIASVDAAIAKLIDTLKDSRPGFAEHAVIVVVSDHGEEFYEHGSWFHGMSLHRESLAVPIVIFDPRNPGGGQRREERVDLLDVPTTLLALAGIEPAPGMRGRALLASGVVEPRDLIAELHPDPPFENHVEPRSQRFALMRWPWKAVLHRDGARWVYRLDRDPLETDPSAGERGGAPVDLGFAQHDIQQLIRADAAGSAEVPLDEEQLEGLRALGYVE